MAAKNSRLWMCSFLVALLLPTLGMAQSFTGTLSGTVTDPTGAVIPNAIVTLTDVATETSAASVSTGPDGLYSFPNLRPGAYELKVSAAGFRDYVQRGITVGIEQRVRADVSLELGAAVQTVEVSASASPLNFETAEVSAGISPNTLKELPLLVAGTVRQAAAFATLMPGVTTGGGGDPFDARINGGLQTGDEAVMDGVSLQQGMMNQTGMISILTDFPMTPDMVSELKVLTSSYAPEYGSSLSGQIVVESKSGGSEFHGGGYWYHRNTVLNARQYGVDERPKDLEHDFGAYIGGPFKLPGGKNIPWFNTGRKKSYFYLNLEAFRTAGGLVRPVISVPTVKMKNGDFSEWVDKNGKLIPVYDPATTRPLDPNLPLSATNVTRDQFMGCDPVTNPQPNVICPDRFANSLAGEWLQYIPDPNQPGLLNNYAVPTPRPEELLGHANYLMFRGDMYHGDRDHISVTVWYQGAKANVLSTLPEEISGENFTAPQFSFVDRIRWDHTFGPTVLNHFAFGYLDRNEGYGSINWLLHPDALPRIPGVATTEYPPQVNLGDYIQMGTDAGNNEANRTVRPAYVFMDTLTWVKGKHTFKWGFEYRRLGENNRGGEGQAGTFSFGRSATGLIGQTSGNSVASFLLEAVGSADVTYRSIGAHYPRSNFYIAHFGDTWKATPKLSINYGARWDTMTPVVELYNRTSFFDPVGINPTAGIPGRLAFAGSGDLLTGDSWGDAGFSRRHPEETWWKGFAPRLGIAYSMDQKTVIRAGYGVFFTQAFYPGWGGGIDTRGFNSTFSVDSTLGGLQPAFILSDGFPIDQFTLPPFIDSAYGNGQDISNGESGGYKPFDANRRSYAQQWNLSIERQFGTDLTVTVAYVANKGTRLPSRIAPLNSLDPSLLSQYGESLYDEFQPGDTELHGVPLPYETWLDELGCSPSLAQALLPFPQYCSKLQGLNENAGNSTYHSFQFKGEKRFSQGLFLLSSYTLAKLIGSSDQTQAEAMIWSGASGVISPFERQRNKALAADDVPQTFSLALVYELPFGRGKRFLNQGGVVDKILGGWQLSSVFKASSGVPFFFRSDTCNVPGEFRVACIPAITGHPWAQGKGTFDPNRPLFNTDGFEPVSAFEEFGYYGTGPRISNLRGFGYHNQNFGLVKNTQITERIRFQIRAEFFNVWNWHIFHGTGDDGRWGNSAFVTDISSPEFGLWNGSVTAPRNIQVGARLEF